MTFAIVPVSSHSPAMNEPAKLNLAVVASPSVQVHEVFAEAIERTTDEASVTGV